MKTFDVDLFVIGGGSGGVRAARIAAGHGAKVMLAEEFRYGGACVIRGCVPKKLFVYASRFSDSFAEAIGFGWQAYNPSFNWQTLITNKDAEIMRLEKIYAKNLEDSGVALVKSRAVLEDAHTVRLLSSGERIRAKYILIATGSKPVRDDSIPGESFSITSDEVFNLDTFPQRILVVGGGYIAVEFAGIFSGLGARISIAYRGDKLLRGFDEDVRSALETAYTQRNVKLLPESSITSMSQSSDGIGIDVSLSDGRTLTVDAVLSAIGRCPHVAGLGLEAVGISQRSNGSIIVDGFSRTNIDSVYAIGDVTDRVNLTPIAIREGHAFADTVFGGKSWRVDYSIIPTAVFSTPEVGTVGLTEAQARNLYTDVSIFKTSFRSMKSSFYGSNERVMMKIIVDKESDKVLGVHIVGDAASEMIQLAGIALTAGATKEDFDRTIAVHPSLAEELVTMRTPMS